MEKIISYLLYPSFTGWLLVLKLVFIFFSLIFFIGIVYFLTNTSWLRLLILEDLVEFLTFKPYEAKKAFRKWKRILSRLEKDLEDEYKLALIEADEVLNDTLKEMGYPGETLGERLNKMTTELLPTLDQTWQAHKIRNNIVHDPTYKLSLDEAKKVISIYERALKDLEAL